MRDADPRQGPDRWTYQPRWWHKGHPRHITWRGWWRVSTRVKDDILTDNVGMVAAGVAFYLLLGLFPGMTALVTVYGLAASPTTIENQLGSIPMPAQARHLIFEELDRVSRTSGTTLNVALGSSLLLMLYAAALGAKALMSALNVAYGREEQRSYLRRQVLAMLMTAGGVMFAVVTLVLIVALPLLLGLFRLGPLGRLLATVGPWVILIFAAVVGLGLLYRFAPHRPHETWRWLTPGAFIALVLWVAASILFSIYVAHFGSYNRTYGSLGAFVILLMWLYISAYAVILGAEINAEAEREIMIDRENPGLPHRGSSSDTGETGPRSSS